MRLLIVTPHYPPDGGPSAPLFQMLAEEFVRRGHAVCVVCGTPHYPSGMPPAGWVPGESAAETVGGVHVARVSMPAVDRTRLPFRLLQFAAYQLRGAFAVRRQTFDAVIASGPGLQTLLPFAIARRHARRSVYSVHDVYPDVGISLGIFRHRPVIAVVRALERAAIRAGDRVRFLAPGFRERLARLGAADAQLSFIPDWVDTNFIRPCPRDNAFAREHGLVERFVVLYGGNLGLSQGLASVLAAADLLRETPRVRFVFVGDGAGRAALEVEATQRRLDNVQFIPYQARERLPEVLSTADVGLISMRRGFSDSLPSKVYSHLASGRALLAAVDPGGDVATLLARTDAAVLTPPEDPVALAHAVRGLASLPPATLQAMGARGRSFAERYHSPAAAATAFEELLSTIAMCEQVAV